MKDAIYRAIRWIFKGVPNHIVNKNIVLIEDANKLCGKTVLITGANRGIGFEIAKKVIQCGASVIIVGRNEDKIKAAADSLGNHCECFTYDLEDVDNISRFLDYIASQKVDVLINNAGISLHENNCFSVTPKMFEQQFRVNLEMPYFLSISFAELLIKEKRKGSIINIVSERGLYCDDRPYGMTKAALISFTKGLARRCVKHGIRVNAVAPGVTATDMTGYDENDNLYNEYVCGKRTFLGAEVAELVAFLISESADCISGEVIACNQGNHLRSDW